MSRSALLIFLALSFACESPEKIKFERYRVAGERLYQQHCANCHQMDGSGFQKLYPPVSGNDWIIENFEETLCMLKYGSNDSLVIEGVQYSLPMKASDLSNLEIAEIATFMYNSWGKEKGLIDVNAVSKILTNCDPKAD